MLKGFREPYLYIWDVIFSIFVIGTLGVLSWRGFWGVLDFVLYPGNKSMSGFSSLVCVSKFIIINFIYILKNAFCARNY